MPLSDSELLDALARLNLVDADKISGYVTRAGPPLGDQLLRDGVLTRAQLDVATRYVSMKQAQSMSAGSGFAKYRILRELGRGGMGVVYEAEDTSLGRRVALKILASSSDADDRLPERFEQEARLLASLRHPGLITIFDFGAEGGIPFIAMELVEGEPLDVALDPRRESPLAAALRDDLRARVAIVRDAAVAVQAAHDAGIIHRDLKPANILLDAAGRPHVGDFGLARRAAATARLTLEGQAMGTPAYMAPEQARAEATDARTDVYGLGAILYEVISRRPPFAAPTIPLLLQKVTDEEPVTAAGADRALDAICRKALAKRPADRYASARELADDLGRWLRGEPVGARAPGAVDRLARVVRRRATALIATLAVVVALGLAVALLRRHAGFEFTTSAPGAVVELDGRPIASPARVRPGAHRVTVTLEGYRTIAETLDFRAGTTIARRFELVRPSATLHVRPETPGMRLRIVGPGRDVEEGAPFGPADVPPGRYRIELWGGGASRVVRTVDLEDGAAWTFTDAVPSAVRWKRELGSIDESPVVADVNGDGTADVVVPSKNGRLHAVSGRDGAVLWEAPLGVDRQSDPALVFVAARAPAIALGTSDGRLLLFDGKSGERLCAFRMGAKVYAGGEFADLDGDGREELLFATADGGVGCVEARRDPPARTPWTQRHAGELISGPPVVAALGGGRAVLVLTSNALYVHEVRDGSVRRKIAIGGLGLALLAANVDGRPGDEAIVGCQNGVVLCIDPSSGTQLWRFEGAGAVRAPAVGDADGDGKADVVVGDESGGLHLLEGATGAPKWRFKGGEEFHAMAAIGDVDGDGKPDVVAGNDDDLVYAIDGASGRLIWSFPARDDIDAAIRVVDLEGDGVFEILCGSNDGWLYALSVRGK